MQPIVNPPPSRFAGRERFPDRLRLPFGFDSELLARDLHNLSAEWIRHFVRANYEGDWSVIPLRAPAGETHPIRMIYPNPTATSFVDTEWLIASPYFREVLAAFQCPLRAVRLMRLTPGSTIKEHADYELSFEEGMVRIHIPVVTNDGVEFYLNGVRTVMEAGSVWYLRLSDPHRVANKGNADRVHLVIDGVVNDWVTGLFESAMARQGDEGAVASPARVTAAD